MTLLRTLSVAATMLVVAAAPTVASAQSCFDLWYERNAIYDANGYCFETDLGMEWFDNSDCYTYNASLSRSEQRRVTAIQREERRRDCNVN